MKLFTRPDVRTLLSKQLEEAHRSLVMYKMAAEEHTAHVEMLCKRIARIKEDLRIQSKENDK